MVDEKVKKNYVLWKKQDAVLKAMAEKSPELDKSGVLRVVVELGLRQVSRSREAQRRICGRVMDNDQLEDLERMA